MIQIFTFAALLAVGSGGRVDVEVDRHRVETDATGKFFASCDDLHGVFQKRVAAVQRIAETASNATAMSTLTQARLTLRTVATVRTLRRARECPWVTDENTEDTELLGSVVRITLAGNPCARAAMAELAPEAHEHVENQLLPLQRAMLVLVSDNCTVPNLEVVNVEDEQNLESRAEAEEEQAQDTIDELFAQAEHEEAGSAGSLLQTEGLAKKIFAWIGAIFFAIAFGVSCLAGTWWVMILLFQWLIPALTIFHLAGQLLAIFTVGAGSSLVAGGTCSAVVVRFFMQFTYEPLGNSTQVPALN